MNIDLRSAFLALAAHALIVFLLLVAVDLSKMEVGGKQKVDTIETLIVDAPIMTTSERMRVQDDRQRRQLEIEKRKQAEIEKQQKLVEEKRKKAEAKRKLQAEKKRKEVERKKQQDEKKAELKKKKDAEAKKKAEQELKRKKEEEQARAEAEKKAKAEADKKRKADEEARKKAAADAKRRAAQEALESQMADELAAEDAARARAAEEARLRDQLRPVLARWVAAMRNKVARNWLRPPGGAEYFECSVFVKQLASGEVLKVKIEDSCGSDVLDESVSKAVLKASPLPLPEDMRVFKKELIFVFKPD